MQLALDSPLFPGPAAPGSAVEKLAAEHGAKCSWESRGMKGKQLQQGAPTVNCTSPICWCRSTQHPVHLTPGAPEDHASRTMKQGAMQLVRGDAKCPILAGLITFLSELPFLSPFIYFSLLLSSFFSSLSLPLPLSLSPSGFHYVAHAALDLAILLPPPSTEMTGVLHTPVLLLILTKITEGRSRWKPSLSVF